MSDDYYMSDPTTIAHQRADHEQYQRQVSLVERVAACWRAIGQPETNRYYIVIAIDTMEFENAPESIIGMPVFEVESPVNGNNVAIITSYDNWTDVPSRFAKEWSALNER